MTAKKVPLPPPAAVELLAELRTQAYGDRPFWNGRDPRPTYLQRVPVYIPPGTVISCFELDCTYRLWLGKGLSSEPMIPYDLIEAARKL